MKQGTKGVTRDQIAFLAHVRHELRTPLNAIIGYSEMLLEEAENHPKKDFLADLRKIHSAGKNLLSVVNEKLDAEKIESGEMAPEKEAFRIMLGHDLRTPLNQIIGFTEILLEDADEIGLKSFIPDLTKIHLAGKRLLALTREFLEPSPSISGEQGQENQSSETRAAVTAIRLLAETESPTKEEEHASLLVVDDVETNRDLLSRRLGRQGHAVTVTDCGRQALDLMRTQAFDLVLLDFMMPELTGYQVLECMKADPKLRHIPVIMISALDELSSVVKCIELGAEDYLPKPFNSVLLKARVGASLEKKRLRDRELLHLRRIEEEKKRADDLLEVILPFQIVEELKKTNTVKPRYYENVAVLFCDIVGFTAFCDKHQPEEVVANLQALVTAYEDIAFKFELEKIKTIGDSFMAAAGLLKPLENPVLNCVRCGMEMLATVHRLPAKWDVRVGIHVGPLMAGVVGYRKYLFDIWGDTVNTAARIEHHGRDGNINVSETAWRQIVNHCQGESLGFFTAKGKGNLEIFRVLGFR